MEDEAGEIPRVFLDRQRSYSRIRCGIRRAMRLDPQILLAVPICAIVIVLFLLEGALYILVRFAGRFAEKWCSSPSARHLIRRMRRTEDFDTYAKCAEALDELTGRNAWKENPEGSSPSTYDAALVQRRVDELRMYRECHNFAALWSCLKSCLETQLHNTLQPSLYSMTYAGTKRLIEEFHTEVIEAINFFVDILKKTPDTLDSDLIWRLSHLHKAFGATGLVFSGGAMLGLHHVGLLEILIELNLLPKILSGTSAGSAIAAFVCTRSDCQVLECLRDPEAMAILRAPFDPDNFFLRFINFIRHGYTINVTTWYNTSDKLFGKMTFLEAFQRTGRVLNVTMSRAGAVGEAVVLNYRNAPHVLISTAVMASTAFPYLGCPIHLLEKDPLTGAVFKSKEYSQRFYHDGSLCGDVPCDALRLNWGVKYIVVSQVNPHVFPFLDLRSHGSPGQPIRGWGSASVWRGGFPLAVLEVALKEHLRFLLRVLALLEIVPSINGINITHVALQTYGGDLNICPSRLYWPHVRFMNNISSQQLHWFLHIGRQMVFPKIWLLRSRLRVEQALEVLTSTARSLRKQHGEAGSTGSATSQKNS